MASDFFFQDGIMEIGDEMTIPLFYLCRASSGPKALDKDSTPFNHMASFLLETRLSMAKVMTMCFVGCTS